MRALITTSVLLLSPTLSFGASVYLNGVNIDGVTDKIFDNCKVQIDGAGDVYIIAKGQSLQQSQPVSPPPVPARPTKVLKHYWLVTEKSAPEMAQYDIDLFVNSKWVRKFLDKEDHVVMEITRHLRPGKNIIQLVAKKVIGKSRRSSSPRHYFRIVVGEGKAGGRNVMITKKLIDYKRTAMETKNFQDQFTLMAQ